MNHALWHMDAHSSLLKPVEVLPKAGYVEINSHCSLISLGTERTVCSGYCDPEIEAHMKVPYMEGSFQFPIKYGYSMIGESPDAPGRYYHFMHPHQGISYVSPDSLTQIPAGMPPHRASLISNMETVINAIWDARIEPGDKVLLIGFGAIGSLLALTLRDFPGIQLQVSDTNPWKLQKASELGLTTLSEDEDFDTVFHVSAQPAGLQEAIKRCKAEGKVIELSWYGTREVSLQLGGSFHYGRKALISSQVSQLPKRKAQDWDYAKRKQLAMDLLMDPKYDALITHRIPFGESPDFFKQLRSHKEGNGLNWLITYQ